MHKHGGDIYSHKDVIDFSANINFRGMPEKVQKAAKAAVDSCGNYPDTECRALREAIAEREQVSAEQIICGNGAADLIFSLVLAKRPRKALLLAPTFYEYEQALQNVECEIEKYYLKESNGFQVQEDFLSHLTPETDMVFFCNPNNPTGVLTEPEFLEQVLSRCECCDTLLVMDECFNDFLEDPKHYSMKKCLSRTKQLFILKAFTKMYAMAGLRLGYGMCSDQELLGKMNRNRQPWSVSLPAQMAGIAAAGEQEFAAKSAAEIKGEREFLKQELEKAGYPVIGSMANYIFFQGSQNLYECCLAKGFLIRDCSNYEGLAPGWYRIAVKGHREDQLLLEALKRRK